MAKSFEFFFDYVSPTAYLAHFVVPGVVERTGAEVVYRPMFQGGVMRATGNKPPGALPAKAAYLSRDVPRCAAHIGVPYHMNPAFPANTLVLTRATMGMEGDPEKRARFIDACFRHSYGVENPVDPADPAQLAAMCEAEGFDVEEIVALGTAQENKDKLRANTEEAVKRGVFGAPSFFVDDELFFGHDRLDYVERAVAS